LAKNRAKATEGCEAKLFEREVWMSGDWRYKAGRYRSKPVETRLDMMNRFQTLL